MITNPRRQFGIVIHISAVATGYRPLELLFSSEEEWQSHMADKRRRKPRGRGGGGAGVMSENENAGETRFTTMDVKYIFFFYPPERGKIGKEVKRRRQVDFHCFF